MDRLIQLLAELSFVFGVPTVMDLPTVVELSPNMMAKTCHVNVVGCYIRPMIYLRNDLSQQQKQQVLCHEVMHHIQEMLGIFSEDEVRIKHMKREKQVQNLMNYCRGYE